MVEKMPFMPESLAIRRLDVSDVEDYRAIRLSALERAPEAFGSVHAIEASRPMAAFAERLATSAVFGAYVEGRIVGMIGFKQESGPKNAHKGFIWGFYVEPDMRQRGVGTRLIASLIAAARDTVEQLTLTVVHQNEAAIALYKRLGFTVYGVEPRALKAAAGYSDEALMVLFLRER